MPTNPIRLTRFHIGTLMLLCATMAACYRPDVTETQLAQNVPNGLSHVVIERENITVHEWGPESEWTPWQISQEKMRPMAVTRDEVLKTLRTSLDGASKWEQFEEGYVNAYRDDRLNIGLTIRENRKGEVVAVHIDRWIKHQSPNPIGTKNADFNQLIDFYLRIAELAIPDADQAELRDWLTTTKMRHHATHSLIRGEIPGAHVLRMTHDFSQPIETTGMQLELTIKRFPEEF